jgi:uncharacterized protein
MSEFKIPGVLVEETQKLPPSVVQVETAIPSFIGYTQKALDENQETLHLVPKKIRSLIDYETYFGLAKKERINLKDTYQNGLTLVKPDVKFLMYYSLQMYFANGGGPCYIVSVGDYSGQVTQNDLKLGFDVFAGEEESTLVVFPDAISLLNEEEFYGLYQYSLDNIDMLKTKFAILDTYLGNLTTKKDLNGTPVNTVEYLRAKVDTNVHAAVYFPHLQTSLNYSFDENAVIEHEGLQETVAGEPFFAEEVAALTVLQNQAIAEHNEGLAARIEVFIALLEQTISIVESVNITADTKINPDVAQGYLDAINTGVIEASQIDISGVIGNLITNLETAQDINGNAHGKTLTGLKKSNSALYNQIKKAIASLSVVLPPSSAIAGIYARVDSTKGIWKAPANVSLNYVIAPTEKISDQEQEDLNMPEDDKPVNAIRTFTGKGVLVWGARTFDGNSNNWKYISVRRLFDIVEKSVQKATQKFIDQPNEANTWVKVKAMIENYLDQLWMDGALAGSTPQQAYYVKVGLSGAESPSIIAGKMSIEVGLAAVRPAEFILLNFTHKLKQL